MFGVKLLDASLILLFNFPVWWTFAVFSDVYFGWFDIYTELLFVKLNGYKRNTSLRLLIELMGHKENHIPKWDEYSWIIKKNVWSLVLDAWETSGVMPPYGRVDRKRSGRIRSKLWTHIPEVTAYQKQPIQIKFGREFWDIGGFLNTHKAPRSSRRYYVEYVRLA